MEPSITITENELQNKKIDDIINLEKSLTSNNASDAEEEIKTPFYLNPIFYYSLAALIAGVLVWAVSEPFFNDEVTNTNGILSIPFISDYLLFGPVAGAIGLFIGFAYGVANHNWKQAAYCGFIGMGVGLLATILTTFVAEIVYGFGQRIAIIIARENMVPEGEYPFRGISFFILMCARALGWSIVSMGAGGGLGVALKSKKLLFNGIVGGMIGGLLGGFLFDPITRIMFSYGTEGELSRAIGISCVGLYVGFFTGLIENVSKEAWFLMQKGPLTGKQFILYKNTTIIGSSPKCEIYLFKDSAIAPKHASVTRSGNKYVIKDEETESGIFVNGKRTPSALLQANDIITIGETVLKYSEKQKDN